MLRVVLVLIVVAILIVVGGFALQRVFAVKNAPMPEAGQTAPTFTLPNQEGKLVNLASYRGQWVVLYFYPKDRTTGCTIEAHNFQRDLDRYKALHAAILGVSLDTVESHREFCTKDSLTFTLLADPDRKVVEQYGSLGNVGPFRMANRNTFLIDPEGRIVKVWTKVSPGGHSAEVLGAIAALETRGAERVGIGD